MEMAAQKIKENEKEKKISKTESKTVIVFLHWFMWL